MSENKSEHKGSGFDPYEALMLMAINSVVLGLLMSEILRPGSVKAFLSHLFGGE